MDMYSKEIKKGFLGGILIGICCIMTIKISNLNLEYGFLINSILFPIGIIMCNLCNGSLFTGNCYLFTKDDDIFAFEKVILSLLGNYIGISILAVISFPFIKGMFVKYVDNSYLYLFVSSLFCNVLITIATYIGKKSSSIVELILGMWLPVMLFVVCGFHHGVVMMFYLAFYGITISNLLIIITGNVIGGFLISKLIKVCE